MSKENPNRRAWLGVVLLVLGAFFLLRNLDLLPIYFPYWFFDWEMLFILIGTAMVITGRRGGLIFILIGGFFLLPDILHMPRFHMRDWWPLILLIIGASILMRTGGGNWGRRGGSSEGGDNMRNDSIDDVNIFGGGNKNITSKNFRGGKVTSIFGGAELNFADTILSTDNATLDVFTLFGGTTLFVPSDWTIRLDGLVSIFGGFSDKRRNIKADPAKVLNVKGLVLFGGGEVKTA